MLISVLLFIVPVFADFDSWQVNAQDDDVYKTGTTFSKADTIQLVGNDYWAGMPPFVPPADFECRSWFRWTDVTIEQGATIESAFFGTFARRYGNPETIFYGIDEDNTTTYSSDPDGRPLTDASVQFDPDWALYQYDWRTSPDIKSVVQEIVDRENWISGNALGIKWGDDGSPTGSDNYASLYSFDMNPIYGCFLNVTWTILGGDETAPTFSNVGTNASHCREVCEFSCLWEDETELSGYIFGWNGTGSFSNDSWTSLSGTSEWANVTKNLPNNDCIISFQWWCNDTSNNWNTTELQTLNVTDCYIFARFTFNISNPEPNENIFFNGSYSVSSSAISSYEWTFGDGNTDSGATVTHSYSTENTFSITLNVTSTDGSDTFTLNLTIAQAQVTGEDQGSSGGLYSLLIHVTWNQVPCFANVTVQNSQGNDSTTRQTDLLGNAKFNLPMGIYFVSTCYRNHTLEDTIHLNENSVASFNFKVKGGPTWIALLAVIIVLAIGYVWMNKKKKTRKHKATLEPRSHKPTTKPRKPKPTTKPREHKR